VVFAGITNAVYGPPEISTQEQATAPAETSVGEQKVREAAQEDKAPQPKAKAPQPKAKEKDTTEEQAKSEAAESDPAPSPTSSSEESNEEDAQEEEDEADRVSYDASVRVTRIVDGDTVDISPAVDGKTRVRFIGVDTPETKKPGCEIQPYGPQASEFTKSQLRGKEVGLEFDQDREDGDERLLVYMYLPDDSMFNETLLEEGYAQIYTVPPNDKYVNRFVEAQEEARGAGRGIWALPADQLSLLDD
jgi:micrococcal nuclease